MQNFFGKILHKKIFSWAKPFVHFLYSKLSPHSDYRNISDEKIKKTFQAIVNEDISQYLHLLKKQNVRFIWGEKDEFAPVSNMIKAKNEVKNAKIFFIKNAGHFPWVDNLDEFLLAL